VRQFELITPSSKTEVLSLLGDNDSQIVAGGTGLLNLMKQRIANPARLISLHKIADLHRIEQVENMITIGALVTLAEIERNKLIQELAPVIVETLREVANPRIRSMATMGGTLAHADPNQDTPVTLAALGGIVIVESVPRLRELALSALYRDHYETVLEPDEMITAIKIPIPLANHRIAFKKFTPASVEDYACVTVCVRLKMVDNQCQSSHILLGGVGPTIIKATSAEQVLKGRPVSVTIADEAALAAARQTEPMDDTRGSADYKRRMVRVWVRRMILKAVGSNGKDIEI